MRYILRRLGFYLAALAAAVAINFLLPRSAARGSGSNHPGHLGGKLHPKAWQVVRAALGLSDAPLPQQFVTYLSHLFRGDFGISYTYFPAPVTKVIGNGLVWTLLLGIVSLIISFLPGKPDRDHRFLAERRVSGFRISSFTDPGRFLPGLLPGIDLAVCVWCETELAADQPCLHQQAGPWASILPFIKSVLDHWSCRVTAASCLPWADGRWACEM